MIGTMGDMYSMNDFRDNYTFFWGSDDDEYKNLIPREMEYGKKSKPTVVKTVKGNLQIVDQPKRGVHVDTVCTLIPRKEAIGLSVVGGKCKIWEELYDAFSVLETDKGKSARNVGKARAVVCDGKGSKYVTFGSSPSQRRKEINSTMKVLGHNGNNKHKQVIGKWLKRVEHCALKYMPVEAREIIWAVNEHCSHPGIPYDNDKQSFLYPAVAAGRNAFLNVHVDSDFGLSLVSAYGRYPPSEDGPIICYFCFPTLKIAVALRSGDMLLFNSKVPHCVSSRSNRKCDAFCISLYTKTLLVGGNNDDQHLSKRELEIACEAGKTNCS